jgi:hypothetical protein
MMWPNGKIPTQRVDDYFGGDKVQLGWVLLIIKQLNVVVIASSTE